MKTYQKRTFLGLVALLAVVLGAGCGGGGVQASWTKTNKDGSTTKQEVSLIQQDEVKKETPKKDSDKTVVDRLGELEVSVADLNAKCAALKSLLGAGSAWIELDKNGDLKLTERANQLLNPDKKGKGETKEQPKAEIKPKDPAANPQAKEPKQEGEKDGKKSM